MKKLHNKGFTLVELIVVISILIILGTIAFISMQNYSKNSRDSVRISDISRMKTSLELYQIESSRYPDPNNAGAVTYSGTTAWSQWDFGQIAFQSVDKLDKLPVDPLTEETYVYSVTSTKKEYQLSWVMETDEYTTLNTTELNANNEIWTLRVSWNYNGETIKVQSGTTTYVLAVPTIISTEPWDLMNLVANDKLAFDGYKNLPQKYAWWHFKQIWETQALKLVNASDLEIYSWNLNDLATDTTKQQAMLTKLKNAYAWTAIQNTTKIARLTNLKPSDAKAQEIVTRKVVYWNKKSLTSDSVALATTAVTYTWCLATTQDGHSIPQLWHLATSSQTKTWSTVISNWSEQVTNTYRCNNGSLETIWTTTAIVCESNHTLNGWVCDPNTITVPCVEQWAPSNATYTVVNETIPYGTTASNCNWNCNNTYHLEWWLCEPDRKQVQCNQWPLTQNTQHIIANVTVNYVSWAQEAPSDCATECKTWFTWSTCNEVNIIWDNISGRKYADWTYALSCTQYLIPTGDYKYAWDNWDWVYWIKPDSNAAFKVHCDMTTDWGGWISISRLPNAAVTSTYATSSRVWWNNTVFYAWNYYWKLSDSEINSIINTSSYDILVFEND